MDTHILHYSAMIQVLLTIAALVLMVGFGRLTGRMAQRKGYKHGSRWGFLLGLLLLYFGLLIVYLLPDRKKAARPQSVLTEVAPLPRREEEAPPQPADRGEALEMVSRLHQQGVLTDEEFRQKVTDLLNSK